jgi:hypothetical protein
LNLREAKTHVGHIVEVTWWDHAGFKEGRSEDEETPLVVKTIGRLTAVKTHKYQESTMNYVVIVTETIEGRRENEGAAFLMPCIISIRSIADDSQEN